MFKTDSLSKTIDINQEKYHFHPRNIFTKTKNESLSKITSRNNLKREKENFWNENTKLKLKESTIYELKQYPQVYFYRHINIPYKYNISSVPEYLIKRGEEKNFMEKLNKMVTNEEDRNTLNALINTKEKENKFKDRYKPPFLNVQNFLKFKPSLYCKSFNYDNRSKSVRPKDNLFFGDNTFEERERENSRNEEKNNDNCDKDKNNKKDISIIVEKNNIKDNQENSKEDNNLKKNDEILEDDETKNKYKISDKNNFPNEKINDNKSIDNNLFKNYKDSIYKKKIKNVNNTDFNLSSKSQSDLLQNRDMGTKMNSFSSVSYNIIAPLYKGFNKFITPSELNKNNKYNESTAFHRVKSISDLTRVPFFDTLVKINRNRNRKLPNFKFSGNVSTNHADKYRINRDLIERPI